MVIFILSELTSYTTSSVSLLLELLPPVSLRLDICEARLCPDDDVADLPSPDFFSCAGFPYLGRGRSLVLAPPGLSNLCGHRPFNEELSSELPGSI